MAGTLDTGRRGNRAPLEEKTLCRRDGDARAVRDLRCHLGWGSGLDWYVGLAKPWFLVPLWAFYLVGLAYYVLAAVVLYRVLVYVDDPGGRAASLALTVGLLLLNELWNYGFFGLRSTLAGFLGIAEFLVVLTALVAALRRYESRRGCLPRTTCGCCTTSPGPTRCGGSTGRPDRWACPFSRQADF